MAPSPSSTWSSPVPARARRTSEASFELAEATGLPSGTIYPILRRLEDDGFIKSRWAEVDTGPQRRRRYYELTGEGRRAANTATAEQRQALRLLSPGWGASG